MIILSGVFSFTKVLPFLFYFAFWYLFFDLGVSRHVSILLSQLPEIGGIPSVDQET